MIILCLFIRYQPHIFPKNIILVQNVSFWEIDHFDLLDFSKKIVLYLVSTYTSKIIHKYYSHTIL